MATINGIFSTKLRGKVGDVVYRVNGQTNTVSQKPSSVSNPKSLSQQTQRMCMATAAIAYSQMKAICDHSFEGVSGKQGNQAEFLRRNVRLLTGQYQSFNYKGNPYMVPNDYIISKGSLKGLGIERIEPIIQSMGKVIDTQTELMYKGVAFSCSILDTLIKGGNRQTKVQARDFVGPTVREFCDAFGIKYGSQITFILNYVPVNYSSFEYNKEEQLETKFKYCRIVLKTNQLDTPMFTVALTDDATLDGDITMLTWAEVNIDKEKSENWDHVRIGFCEARKAYEFCYSTFDIAEETNNYAIRGNNVCGNAIISYKQDSKWLRSTEKMIVWREDEQGNRDNVVMSYSPNDPKYLNNADK